jgi:hypothetical protein
VALAYFYIAVLVVVIAYFSYASYKSGILDPLEYYIQKYFSQEDTIEYVQARPPAQQAEEPDDWFSREKNRVGFPIFNSYFSNMIVGRCMDHSHRYLLLKELRP